MIDASQIDAIGKVLIGLATVWLAYRDRKCARDVDAVHAKMRAKENGTCWTEELRKPRLFRRKWRKKDAGDTSKDVT